MCLLFAPFAVLSVAFLAGASSSELFPSPNERFGFGVTTDIKDYDVAQLHAGWYVNWGATSEVPHPAGVEYVQIIRVHSDGTYSPEQDTLSLILQHNLGLTWIIGNEPDCPYQDNVHPTVYAQTYHQLYQFLKEQDPTCRVAIGGVVQATPLRLQYLDMIWEAYQVLYGERMPVDVWNVHNFILREKQGDWGSSIPPGISASEGELREIDDHDRMDLFEQQLRVFRGWMREKGERDKPLIISEYGILFNQELGFGYSRVRDFMLATFDYFLTATDPEIGYPADGNRLVQRWAWYSLDDDSFEWGTTWSNLFDPATREIESLGEDFADYIVGHDLIRPYWDLQPVTLTLRSTSPLVYGEPTTLTLCSRVVNHGNSSTGPFAVSFWDEESLLDEFAIPGVGPRYLGEVVVETSWTDPITMPHTFRVLADSARQVDEWKEDNNSSQVRLDIDLAIVQLRSSMPLVELGGSADISVTATVSNPGDVAVRDLAFQFLDGSSGEPISTTNIAELGPGGWQEVSLIWPHQPAGSHPVVGIVDPEDLIKESNEDNNAVRVMALVVAHRRLLPLIVRNG